MSISFTIIITILTPFFLNLIATPRILHYSHKFKWYDRLDHRKIHSGDIPRLGGIGIFLSFLIGALIPLSIVFQLFSAENTPWTLVHYLPVFAGIVLIHIAGLIDDFSNMRALYKFLVQLAAASIVAFGGFVIRSFTIPFTGVTLELGVFAVPITVFWIVSLSNAINLVDGMDGLAGGISAIASLFLGAISLAAMQYGGAIISFALFGALIGFLVFNFPPARIFMGDSGALFLGFVLAVVPLIDGNGSGVDSWNLIPLITLLMIPVLDTAAAIIRRKLQGKPIFSPDREHLHHKLLDLGLRTRYILLIVYGTGVVLGLIALSWSFDPVNERLFLIIATWLLCVAGFLVLDRVNRSRKEKVKRIESRSEVQDYS